MNSNPEINQILVKYLKTNQIQYTQLDDVPYFKDYFLNYLQIVWKTSEENLKARYKRWCKALSEGDTWTEVRQGAVYGLHFHCGLNQYQIANLLHVSVRTIRQDMQYLEQRQALRGGLSPDLVTKVIQHCYACGRAEQG